MVQIKFKLGDNSYKLMYNKAIIKDNIDNKIIVFGYVRVSSELQSESESIQSQIKNIEGNCKWQDKILSYIYVDDGISGKTIVERPAVREMLEEIKRGSVKNNKKMEICTCYMSRLTRSSKDMEYLCDELPRLGCLLNCLDIYVDLSNDNGIMIAKMITNSNELQRKNTSRNVKNVMNELSSQGKLITKKYGWTLVPYEVEISGKKRIKHTSVQNPIEQKNIAKLIEVWNENNRDITYIKLSKLMNRFDGYEYKEEDPAWTPSRVDRIIYKQILYERVIDENKIVPSHLKEIRVKEEIVKLINGGLIINSPYIIARKIDKLCLFRQQITVSFVAKMIKEMGDVYINQIYKQKINYEKKIIDKIISYKGIKYDNIAKLLNADGITTLLSKKWTRFNLNNFCLKHNIDNLIRISRDK